MTEYDFIKNKENRHIKINIKSALIYLCVYLISIVLLLYVGGYMFLYMFIVLTIMPILAVITLVALVNKLKFKLSVSDKEIIKNDILNVGFIMNNKSIFPCADVKLHINIENDFYKANTDLTYGMTIAPLGKTKTRLPLVFDRNGLINVELKKIEIRDILSMISFVYESNMSQKIGVMPEHMDVGEMDKNSYMVGVTQNEENNLKGNDFSDVSNIREYIPGDRIKDIHWKLSAKKDNLMVKERIRLSEEQLAILVDISGEHKLVDSVVSYAYNILKLAIEDGIPVNLMWWNEKINELEEYEIMNKHDIGRAYKRMYEAGVGEKVNKASEYIRATKVKLQAYIKVCAEDGVPRAIVIE